MNESQPSQQQSQNTPNRNNLIIVSVVSFAVILISVVLYFGFLGNNAPFAPNDAASFLPNRCEMQTSVGPCTEIEAKDSAIHVTLLNQQSTIVSLRSATLTSAACSGDTLLFFDETLTPLANTVWSAQSPITFVLTECDFTTNRRISGQISFEYSVPNSQERQTAQGSFDVSVRAQ
jgi:hypothetical protein